MIRVIDVFSDSTMEEIEFTDDKFDSSQIVFVVDENRRTIYLWTGKKTSLRHKFAGAKAFTKFKQQYGKDFEVIHVNDGDESYEFLTLKSL